MNQIEIYGTKISLPEPSGYIETWGTDVPSEQYWRRLPIPDYFELVDYDKEGNALLDERQREYALEEVRRCREGFWFMNNGSPTFITGKNYFYIQWFKLENDIYPDFRATDRRYFLFLNHWEHIPWCLGVIRGKKRREGASSQAVSNLIYECIFYRNSFCGLVSKTEKDGKITFTNMLSFAYRQLPVFLKPKQLNNKDSVSELVFAHKTVEIKGTKGSVMDTDTGHRSRVDYRAPGKNSYDSGRLSRGLFDEGGKWDKENPFSVFIAIVSKTLVQGSKRVGFMECPSTVNEMTKSGGDEYKKVWDEADQFAHSRTPNRLVRYFTPAYDGFVGFIDKYGESVIGEPTKEQYDFLVSEHVGAGDLTAEDISMGAKQYLINVRNAKEGAQKEEEVRMNPFDEREMFLSSLIGCLYNSFKISDRDDFLSYNEGFIEKGHLMWEDGHEFFKVIEFKDGTKEMQLSKLNWVPSENGKFEKIIDWMPKEANNVYMQNGFFFPNGNYAMRIGADPFKFDKTKDANRKSNCAAYAYQMEDPLNPNDKYNDTFTMAYVDRSFETDEQYENILKMAWFCGCQALIERNIGLDPKKYFRNKKCSSFLMWLPNEVEFGIYTDGVGNTVQAVCNYTSSYIERFIDRVYFRRLLSSESGWKGFEVADTQKYDDAMGSGFALIASKVKKYSLPTDTKNSIENILPSYKAN